MLDAQHRCRVAWGVAFCWAAHAICILSFVFNSLSHHLTWLEWLTTLLATLACVGAFVLTVMGARRLQDANYPLRIQLPLQIWLGFFMTYLAYYYVGLFMRLFGVLINRLT